MKPKALKKGDKVAIISPSSPATKEKVEKARLAVEKMGLTPIVYPSCLSEHGHLSGTDDIRAKDINDAFENKEISGVVCLRGGYGTLRLLNLIDYETIKRNPKYFIGYSDITGLHVALNRMCNLVTYHGPMAASGWINNLDDYTLKYLEKSLFSMDTLGIVENPEGEQIGTLYPGICEGEIVGGNLSLLVSTLGSPYEIDTKNKILFIEEVIEHNYRIDKMFMSLDLANKFSDCKGIILGTFTNCEPDTSSDNFKDLDLMTIFNEIIGKYKKPIIFNFRAGHNYPQPTFPFGVKVKLNADDGTIEFLEPSNI